MRPLNQDNLASLAHETERLSRLVGDLRTPSLSDLGALTYYREPVDLAELLTDTVPARRRDAEERGLALTFDVEEHTTMLADETRLGQVFGNLMQNSLPYTDAPARSRSRPSGRAVTRSSSGTTAPPAFPTRTGRG